MGRDEKANELEIDTDTDEVTESDETVSTEKSSRNIGTSSPKLFYKWLPEGCLKFFFLLLNSVALVSFRKWMLLSEVSNMQFIGSKMQMI